MMKTAVQCVLAHDSAVKSARLMRDRGLGFLLVCDKEGKVLGIVTDRNIAIRLVADGLPADTAVGAIMSRDVLTCGAQDHIGKAQGLMTRHRRSCIVCVDEAGRLEGILSLVDILGLGEGQPAQLLRTLDTLAAHP